MITKKYILDFSIDEYLSKSRAGKSSISSIISTTTSSTASPRQSSSITSNILPANDDYGLFDIFKAKSVISLKSCLLLGFGTLDFEIIWTESLNILTITLLRARNLRSYDSNGFSDPYVKLHLVPGVAKVN